MKFRYDEKVEIIDGFYRGQQGTIKKVAKSWFYGIEYEVYFNNLAIKAAWIKEEHLRSLDYPYKDVMIKIEKLK